MTGEGSTVGFVSRIRIFLEMIKFSHTIFALPFALTGALLAAGGIPTPHQIFWIIMAMIGARTAAMGLNRLIDADIDARNPRTSGRALPAGLLGKSSVALWIVAATALLLVSAARLNPLCLYLSPVAIFFLVLYSYCKRFTSLAHLVLGLCLSAAPIGAWIAITGEVSLPPLLLGCAVLFWSAGFDVLYALQDLEFDRATGLHSIPAKLGVRRSLMVARLFHLVMVVLLVFLFAVMHLGLLYLVGLCLAASLLVYEHLLLRTCDLSKLDTAFFNMNGYISLTLFLFTLADLLTTGKGA